MWLRPRGWIWFESDPTPKTTLYWSARRQTCSNAGWRLFFITFGVKTLGIISQLLERRTHPSQQSLAAIFGLNSNTYAGVAVTEETAMSYSAVFAAVRLLSWTTAMLPLLTYRRRPAGGKDRATDLPLYNLLKEETNPEMTAFDFRATIMSHAVGRGNGYAEIEWSNAGQPLALWPLNPAKMEPTRTKGELRYLYTLPDGTTANLPAWRIHHIRGLGNNGIIGYSPIRLAMQAIGLGLGTEEYGSRLFSNGAKPGGIVKHPGKLSDTAYERIKKSWNAEQQGLSNAHRTRILEEGMSFENIGVAPEEAQFLETRKFQVNEIARWFNVPPHMIADLDKATFSNIEEMGIGFVIYSLGPWLTNMEQALQRDLLTPTEKRSIFIEHLVDALLRGRILERYQAYQTAIMNGIMSPNEARDRENLNPYDGGDVFLQPLNMAPVGTTPAASSVPAQRSQAHGQGCACGACHDAARSKRADANDDDDTADGESDHTKKWRRSKQKLARDYIPLFADVAGRMVRREVNDVRRAVSKHLRKRSVGDFREWLDTFYPEFADVLADAFEPLMETYAAQVATATADELGKDDPGLTDELTDFIKRYLANMAEGYTASSRNQLEALIADAEAAGIDIGDEIEARLDGWEESRADQMADGESFEAGNALAVANYRYFNVRRLLWAASGKSCPFCRRLSGKTAGIEEYMVQKGDTVAGDPGDTPMLVRSNMRHGPIHRGCDCVTVAA